MALLSRKGLLAIAAVIDVARSIVGPARSRPRVLAERHALPAPSRASPPGPGAGGILNQGTSRYELAHERRRITADDILRAAGTIEDASDRAATPGSTLLHEVVIPAVGQAERAFSMALARINLEELVRKAEALPDATA